MSARSRRTVAAETPSSRVSSDRLTDPSRSSRVSAASIRSERLREMAWGTEGGGGPDGVMRSPQLGTIRGSLRKTEQYPRSTTIFLHESSRTSHDHFMVTIAFIGAGSVVFTRQLVADLLGFPELADVHLAL